MRTEKKISYFNTEFLSQFEMNAEMDISKNQWRSTGGKDTIKIYFMFQAGDWSLIPNFSSDFLFSVLLQGLVTVKADNPFSNQYGM